MSHPALAQLDHRPWPLPERAWRQSQSWRHLLFAHWPVPSAALRPHIPEALEIDEFDGTAWLGVVPFLLHLRLRYFPPLPAFPEINVRSYVRFEGRPGVWFFSLDARNALAVWGARWRFRLPYHRARMAIALDGETVHYRSERVSRGPAHFRADYRPVGAPHPGAPGSLDHFLTERYCLYARGPRGALFSADVHHTPWPLQPAEARFATNSMTQPLGIPLPDTDPLLHFARRLDVAIWPLRPLAHTAKG